MAIRRMILGVAVGLGVVGGAVGIATHSLYHGDDALSIVEVSSDHSNSVDAPYPESQNLTPVIAFASADTLLPRSPGVESGLIDQAAAGDWVPGESLEKEQPIADASIDALRADREELKAELERLLHEIGCRIPLRKRVDRCDKGEFYRLAMETELLPGPIPAGPRNRPDPLPEPAR